MENLELIQNLSHFSKHIGARISDVQGGGGNTSVKYGKYMSIKASGYALKDLSNNSGFSVMDLESLYVFLDDTRLTQDKFDELLGSFITSKKYNKPSMEAGLHAIIDYAYVAHTHSVFVNIFTCSIEGKKILSNIFPDALWVSYATPGLDLFKQFYDSINNISATPKIIFLENHGLIICSDDHEEIIHLNKEINNKLIREFRLSDLIVGEDLSRENLNNLLFPDQAVYLEKIKNIADIDLSVSAIETISVVNYLLNSMAKLKLTPKYLDQAEKHKLINLESEKYRKNLEK
tara:strand:+ start:3416 stop:4285 length:870 start_codon:yes stop_codon:yes gene_type:complete